MTDMHVVGVIGLGSMGRRYASHFRNQATTTVVGCDPCSEKFLYGIDCKETVYELLDSPRLDVVVIASPAEHHLSTLYMVLARHPSCSILMEKPIANRRLTPQDIRRCEKFFRQTIAVGYCWRFHPYARQLYEARHAIRDVTFYVGSDMRTWPGEHYAAPLREFSHELDLVCYLTQGQHVDDVGFTPNGRYQIDGTHQSGRWSVRIAPFQSPSGRWVKVAMADGNSLTYHWDVRPRVIEAMYRSLAAQVTHATGPEGLFCSLRAGVATTLLVDKVESMLDAKGKACRIM